MEPFLKWAGGKRWLISRPLDLLPKDEEIKRYFEPFLGSGALFFHLEPKEAFLSDVNSDLINSYIVIRDHWCELNELLWKFHELHGSELYYQLRRYKPRDPIKRAARFIYLNRTCWNGLYRVNKKGMFNVPIGTKTKVILDYDDFEGISSLLRNVHLEISDFGSMLDKVSTGDFVFIDPPYTVQHNMNGFIKYNENIFSWNDQIRLKDSILKGINRGAKFLIFNANHDSIKELYRGMGHMIILERPSIISGKADTRGIYTELAIKCY